MDNSLFEFAIYDETKGERTGYSDYSYWRSTIQVFMKNKVAIFLLFLMITLLALQ